MIVYLHRQLTERRDGKSDINEEINKKIFPEFIILNSTLVSFIFVTFPQLLAITLFSQDL
jgi:hypothetical protein